MGFQEQSHFQPFFVIELFRQIFQDDEALLANNHPMQHPHGLQNLIPIKFLICHNRPERNETLKTYFVQNGVLILIFCSWSFVGRLYLDQISNQFSSYILHTMHTVEERLLLLKLRIIRELTKSEWTRERD